MSEFVAMRDCTILGIVHKDGEVVTVELNPAYQKDLIESGLIGPKGSSVRPRAAQPSEARPAPRPTEGEAKE
jgi:hypothetical protein